MLLYLLSRIISATGAFVYPAYASYKTLSRRPASEPEIERWLMYWSVLGTIVGLEYVAEWTISWVPFYHVFKAIFLLYLALPQTRGASYVYSVHLHPLIAKHEVEIDAALGRIKEQIWRWMMMRVRGLWEHVASGQGPREAMAGGSGVRDQPPPEPEPAGPTQLAYTLWQTYGPALTALLHAPSKSPSPPSPPSYLDPQSLPSTSSNHRTQPSYPYTQPPSQPQPHDSRARGTTSAIDMHPDAVLLARRRALEAELSALPLPNPHGEAPVFPIPQPATSPFPTTQSAMPRAASSTYLPAPGDERGRYEEIRREEVESVDEGEGVGDDRGGAGASGGSWSSWWRGSPGGYERVKTE
ncbi:TB2/DP1, HVA22 family-domain-containing protein [Gautieria morchelliformis]|nr:TB2/DP1, HVA22 family-domain-containing protein [Gautieria morchelliformis]